MSSKRPAYKGKYEECEEELKKKETDCKEELRVASGRDFSDLVTNVRKLAGRITYQQGLDMVRAMVHATRELSVMDKVLHYHWDLWENESNLKKYMDENKFSSYGYALADFLGTIWLMARDVHSVMETAVENIGVLNR